MPKDMFGPVTRVSHTNKSYNYAQGGPVRGRQTTPDDPNYDPDTGEEKDPVSPEMADRTHDLRQAGPGAPGTYSARVGAAGARESTNVEDTRALPMSRFAPTARRPPLQKAYDRVNANIEYGHASSDRTKYKSEPGKDVDATIKAIKEKPSLGPPRKTQFPKPDLNWEDRPRQRDEYWDD